MRLNSQEANMEPQRREERRNFFRIEDEIILQVREITSDQLPNEEELPDSFSLPSKLEQLTVETSSISRKIPSEYADVLEYLKILEQKIDLIAQAFLINECDFVKRPTQNITLSASGLSFDSEIEVKPGQLMELTMMLPPMLIGIVTYGRVIHCEAVKSHSLFNIGVEFLGLNKNDNELLVRYIVKKQSQQLRELAQQSA